MTPSPLTRSERLPLAKRFARRFSPPAASWPVLLVAGLMVAVLLALSSAYGFHRDELYFIVAGRHPAFGYPDQPPLTPLLTAASVAVLGLSPTAVRVLPALAMGARRRADRTHGA